MIQKTCFYYLLSVLALPLLTGCFANSTEGCDFRGSLTLTHDRTILPPSMALTTFDLLVYPGRAEPLPLFEQCNDTTLKDIRSEKYTVLSINNAHSTGAKYRNSSTANETELYQPANTDTDGNRFVRTLALPVFLSSGMAEVPPNDAVEVLMLYKRITKQVNWRMNVIRKESAAEVDIASCNARIGGVVTAYKIPARKPIESQTAAMVLNLASADQSMYAQTTHLFGFADANAFRVEVVLADGFKRTASYDLTEKFKHFTGDIMTVELELIIDGHKADLELKSITITDWQPGEEIEEELMVEN